MRRLASLALFVAGYLAVVALGPAVAVLPALAAFLSAGLVLTRADSAPLPTRK